MKPASADPGRLLANVALVVAAGWIVIALTTWGSLQNGARFASPWLALDGQALLFAGAVQIRPIVGVVLLNLAAVILGYAWVIRPIWGGRDLSSPPWIVFAGSVPGMLMLMALSRLTTLLVPNPSAPMLLWAMIAVAVGFVLFQLWRLRRPSLSPPVGWAQVWPALAAFAGVLILSVQVDRMHVMGSASQDFIREIYLHGSSIIGSSGHWPLISQHYDEAAFLYPVVYGLVTPDATASGTLTVIYWLTLSIGRLGMMCLIYLAVRGLGVDRLSSLLLTAFVWAASLSINPIASNMIIDSFSPLGSVLHLARILAPVTPLLFISMSAGLTHKPSAGGLLVAAAAGCGLASMTTHLALIFVFAAGVLILTAISPAAARSLRLWRAACAASVLVLLAFSFAYGVQTLSATIRVAALLGSVAVGAGLLIWALAGVWRSREDPERLDFTPRHWLDRLRQDGPMASLQSLGASTPYWAAAAAGYTVGFVFFGNVLLRAWKHKLGVLWPWDHVQIWDRYYGTLATKPLVVMQSPYCHAGWDWGFRTIIDHCGSLPMFVRTYGLSLVLIVLVIAWRLRGTPAPAASNDRASTMIFWGVLLCLAAQPIAFVLLDFVFSPELTALWERHLSVWLRVRLLEPWFYGGILLSLVIFLRQAAPRERRWAQSAMMIAIATFALNPFVAPAMLTANFAYLMTRLFGL
jgi:hypothetical protein